MRILACDGNDRLYSALASLPDNYFHFLRLCDKLKKRIFDGTAIFIDGRGTDTARNGNAFASALLQYGNAPNVVDTAEGHGKKKSARNPHVEHIARLCAEDAAQMRKIFSGNGKKSPVIGCGIGDKLPHVLSLRFLFRFGFILQFFQGLRRSDELFKIVRFQNFKRGVQLNVVIRIVKHRGL